MKIAVFSDSHGDISAMLAAVRSFSPDLILHLGDHTGDADELTAETGIPVRRVRGNCDFATTAPLSDMFELSGRRILMCHGHRHQVKLGLDSLLNAAHFSHADIVLYGHTHQAYLAHVGNMLILNPGSIGSGTHRSWAKLTIENEKTDAEIIPV
ncbi:MAG: metallophosphoesterase [Oscillospiraceae bacterium]